MPASGFRPGRADTTLERLFDLLHLPRDETLLRLLQQQEAGRARLTLVPNATMPQIATVEERRSRLPGIRVDTRPRRRPSDGPPHSFSELTSAWENLIQRAAK